MHNRQSKHLLDDCCKVLAKLRIQFCLNESNAPESITLVDEVQNIDICPIVSLLEDITMRDDFVEPWSLVDGYFGDEEGLDDNNVRK